MTALAVIPMDADYGILVGCLILGGFIFFYILCKIGEKIMRANETQIIESYGVEPSPPHHRGVDNLAIEIS